MLKSKYLILIFIFLIIIPLVIIWHNNLTKVNSLKQTPQQNSNKQLFTITSVAKSPKLSQAVTNSTIIEEAAKSQKNTLQKFVIKSSLDDTERTLFLTSMPNVTFEPISEQNWAPTNRFIFVYADLPNNIRDIIFFKTDGKFTNGQYYIHPTGLYPNISIVNAKWIEAALLEVQAVNTKTTLSQKYLVNFDDDTGIMLPETK